MAKYTIELREVVDSHVIFDFNYPFYDEKKRAEFQERFIRHFYFREIGCDTVDRFKWYLRDKFDTVFPYYNKLMESAQIEYSILDNYKVVENYTIKRENNEKISGVSSTVGQTFDEQTATANETRNTDRTENVSNIGDETVNDNGNQKTTSTSETDENGSHSKQGATATTTAETKNNKFLDTPQGMTDLSNSNYVTNMTYDSANGNQTVDATEAGTTTNHSETTGTSNTDTTNKSTRETTFEGDTTGNEKTDSNVTSEMTAEQRTTQDNNTRSTATGTQTEVMEHTKTGNIGVDTDSDMIEKHNRLQKTLMNIERMFFDECEDLFMLVF